MIEGSPGEVAKKLVDKLRNEVRCVGIRRRDTHWSPTGILVSAWKISAE